MTIAQVSEKYQLTQDTIRYYEKVGLIPRVPRNKAGVRDFDEASCRWIEFIKCMRSAGMPINKLVEYVTLFKDGRESLQARKNLLIEQKENLLKKQQEIQNTLERLEIKIKLYEEIEQVKRNDFFEEP